MRRLAFSFLLGVAAIAAPANTQDLPHAFPHVPVADSALAEMRGGFGLPGGLDVSIAVQSDTRINGLLMLRSVFVVDAGAPVLNVYGRTDGAVGVGTGSAGAPPTTSVNISTNAAAIGGAVEGLSDLGLSGAGSATAASGGTVRIEKQGAGSQVVLSQPTLDVRHLVGQAYGSAAANRGNDVTVDTVTNINIDLRNAMPSNVGSTMFRVEALANDSATRLGR